MLTLNKIMQAFLWYCLFFILVASLLSCKKQSDIDRIDGSPSYNLNKNWEVVFEDNFDTKIDTNVWEAIDRGLNYNNEAQSYIKDAIAVKNGLLSIRTTKQRWIGESLRPDAPYEMVVREYTSGLVHTKDRSNWLYGKFEVYAKCAKASGILSAIWMLPKNNNWPPEIDIAEVMGDSINKVHMTSHWNEHGHKTYHSVFKDTIDYSKTFHLFTVEWEPGIIRWYVDRIKHHELKHDVPSTAHYLIFSTSVGSWWTGMPKDTLNYPNEFLIDWVKIYQRK